MALGFRGFGQERPLAPDLAPTAPHLLSACVGTCEGRALRLQHIREGSTGQSSSDIRGRLPEPADLQGSHDPRHRRLEVWLGIGRQAKGPGGRSAARKHNAGKASRGSAIYLEFQQHRPIWTDGPLLRYPHPEFCLGMRARRNRATTIGRIKAVSCARSPEVRDLVCGGSGCWRLCTFYWLSAPARGR